jgi:hypothetical protein
MNTLSSVLAKFIPDMSEVELLYGIYPLVIQNQSMDVRFSSECSVLSTEE